MKTQTYAYVLQRAVELTGRVYPCSNEEEAMFRSFMAHNLRRFWEMFPWPDLVSTTQYFFGEAYNESTAYASGDVVYFTPSQKYYQAIRATTGNAPATASSTDYTTNSAYWSEAKSDYSSVSDGDWISSTTYNVGDIRLYVPTQSYYQLHSAAVAGTVPTNTAYWGLLSPFIRQVDPATASPEIGTIFAIWREDPRVSIAQQQVPIDMDTNGILVREALPYIYVVNRQVPPSLSVAPSTIPYIFAESIALAAAGNMLRSVDGKVDLGDELSAMAEEFNNSEADKVCRQEMIVKPITFTR
jgi:hypothetical protein